MLAAEPFEYPSGLEVLPALLANEIVVREEAGGIVIDRDGNLTPIPNDATSVTIDAGGGHDVVRFEGNLDFGAIDLTVLSEEIVVLPLSDLSAGDIHLDAEVSSIVRANASAEPAAIVRIQNAFIAAQFLSIKATALDRLGVFGFKKDATADIHIFGSNIQAEKIVIEANADTSLLADIQEVTVSGNPTFTFSSDPSGVSTITRSEGSWLSDGFVPGHSLDVVGSASNDGAYYVEQVTETTLTLAAETVLVDESVGDITVSASAIIPNPEDIVDSLLGFQGSAIATISNATSNVLIDGTTAISATGNVEIASSAESKATPFFPGFAIKHVFGIGAVYAASHATSNAIIEGGTTVQANQFSLTSSSGNTISASAMLNAKNTPFNIAFAGSVASSNTDAHTGPNTEIRANNITVAAESEHDLATTAATLGQGGGGLGMSVAFGIFDSATDAYIAGIATASGSVDVTASSVGVNNLVESDTRALGNTGAFFTQVQNTVDAYGRAVANRVIGELADSFFIKRVISKTFPLLETGKLNLSGAFAVADVDNHVDAYISGTAIVSAGDLNVTAEVLDRKSLAANGETTSDSVAIGGAVAFGRYDVSADATIKSNAVTNATGDTNVTATVTMPVPEIDFSDPQEIVDYITNSINTKIFNGFARNASGGDEFGLAGAFNMMVMDHAAHATIDDGASVNQFVVSPDPSQSVNVFAETDVRVRSLVGGDVKYGLLDKMGTAKLPEYDLLALAARKSAKAKISELREVKDPKAGFGGAVAVLQIDNEAIARIGQAAEVDAEDDINVLATTSEEIVSVAESRGKTQNLGVFGSGGAVLLNSSGIAIVDEFADVSSGGDLRIQATTTPRIFNLAGSQSKGASVGVGASVAVSDLNTKTLAVIGDQSQFVTGTIPGDGSGEVSVGGNLSMDAISNDAVFSLALAGSTAGKGEEQNVGSKTLNVNVAGDASINDIDAETRTVIADGANVTATDGFFSANSDGLPDTTADFRFEASANSIRREGGSWLREGYRPGQTIEITDTASNDGFFKVVSVSDDEVVVDGAVVDEVVEASAAVVVAVNGAPTITFVHNPNPTGKDRITRSRGSWIADGFRKRQKIRVSGSSSNDETYIIAEVSPDEIVLERAVLVLIQPRLTNESTSDAFVSVVRPANRTEILAISGAVVVNNNPNSTGLAGSYSENDVVATTQVTVSNATLDFSGRVLATANTSPEIQSYAVSGSVTADNSVAGQFVKNGIQSTTATDLTNAQITAGGPIVAGAQNRADIQSIGGAVGVSKGASVGASIVLNDIDSDVRASVAGGSEIDAAGDVDIDANDVSFIRSVTIGGAVAVSTPEDDATTAIAVGVSAAENVISGAVEAIVEASTIDSGGEVTVSASSEEKRLFDLDQTGAGGITVEELNDASTETSDDETTAANEFDLDQANNRLLTAKLIQQFRDHGQSLDDEAYVKQLDESDGWAVIDPINDKTWTIRNKSGTLEVQRTNIQAVAVAASVAVSAGEKGIALSGGGAGATNVVLTETMAHVKHSDITAASNLDVQASNTSGIVSTIVAASIAVGVGTGGTSAAAAIGAAASQNFIGFDKSGDRKPAVASALVDQSAIDVGGEVSVSASTGQSIGSLVFAGSVAVSAGTGGAGLSLAGAGAGASNKIAADATALFSNSTDVSASDVRVQATDTSLVRATAGAVSVAVAVTGGGIGGALSVGVGIGRNTIDTIVDARIANIDLTSSTREVAGVFVDAASNSIINAVAFAASVAVGVGASGGVAVAGSGAEATNVILGMNRGQLIDSQIQTTGDVRLTATSESKIDAKVLAIAVGVGAGGTAGVGASVGASVARNLIGWDPNAAAIASDYESDQVVSSLARNRTVRIADGPRQGEVYRYLGEDLNQEVDLSLLSYNDTSVWLPLSLDENASVVWAGSTDTSIDAGGDLMIAASARQEIDSLVLGGSIAVGAGGTAGVGGAIGGSIAVNRISTSVRGFISGDDSGINVTNASVTAKDESSIDATAIGIGAGVGGAGVAGVGLSVGFSSAENHVANKVSATIIDVEQFQTTGHLIVRSEVQSTHPDETTISATAVAASVSTGAAGIAGVGVSGAGSGATNIILTESDALISGSSISVGTNLDMDAISKASIDATVVAASAAVGAAGITGVGTSVGVSVAENRIGFHSSGLQQSAGVRAQILDSTLSVGGQLSVDAKAQQTIRAEVGAGSVAVAGAAIAGVATSGAGVDVANRIGQDVIALISGGSVSADAVQVTANDQSVIDSTAGAVSVSISAALVAASVDVSGSTAKNEIGNTVSATITGLSSLISTSGITVTAAEQSDIDATTFTASASTAALIGGAVSVGETSARNTITTRTSASIEDSGANNPLVAATVQSGGPIRVAANDQSSIDAVIDTASIANGFASIAVGVAIAENVVQNQVESKISQSTLEVAAGGVDVTSVAIPSIHTQAIAVGTAGAVPLGGAAAAGIGSRLEIEVTTDARLTDVDLTAQGQNVRVHATSVSDANPNTSAGSGSAGLAISAIESKALIGGRTQAGVGGRSQFDVGLLDVFAKDTNSGQPQASVDGTGALAVGAALLEMDIRRSTLSTIDPAANVVLNSGSLNLTAESESTVLSELSSVLVGGLTVSGLVLNAKVGGQTIAGVGEGAIVDVADAVTIDAISNNTAEANTRNTNVGLIAVSVGTPTATIDTLTQTQLLGDSISAANIAMDSRAVNDSRTSVSSTAVAAVLNVGTAITSATAAGQTHSIIDSDVTTSGDLDVSAQTDDRVETIVETRNGGTVTVDVSQATALAESSTSVTVTPGRTISSGGDVTLASIGIAEADASARGGAGGLVTVSSLDARATTNQSVRSEIGDAAVIDAGGTIQVSSSAPANLVGSDRSKAESGDGYTTAASVTTAGGAITVQDADSFSSVTPTLTNRIGQGAELSAGDITIIGKAAAVGEVLTTGAGGGIFAAGAVDASLNQFAQVLNLIEPGSMLNATSNITVSADASMNQHGDASANIGGVISVVKANTTLEVDYHVANSIRPNSTLRAGGTIDVDARSFLFAFGRSDANSGGLGADSESSNSPGDPDSPDLKGIKIGGTIAFSQTDVQPGAVIEADVVRLAGRTPSLFARMESNSRAAGFGTDSDAVANVDILDTANVTIGSGARVTGRSQVDLLATHEHVDASSFSRAVGAGAFGDSDSTSIVDLDSFSSVWTNPDAQITTNDLNVDAIQNVVNYDRRGEKGGGIDFGSVRERGDFNPVRDIVWLADVTIQDVVKDYELEIDAAGNIVRESGITPFYQNGQLQGTAPIRLSDVPRGTVNFSANQVPPFDGVTPVESRFTTANETPVFTFVESLNSIDIDVQHSGAALFYVQSIVPYRSDQPEIHFDIENMPVSTTFDVQRIYSPTEIHIDVATSNLSLIGVNASPAIDNPIGSTNVATSGSLGWNAAVRTNQLDIEADGSVLGFAPIELVETFLLAGTNGVQDAPATLSIQAGLDVDVDVRGLLRKVPPTFFLPQVEALVAGGDLNVRLLDAIAQVNDGAEPPVQVRKTFGSTTPQSFQALTQDVNRTLNAYLFGFNGGAEVLNYGVFGTGSIPVDSVYKLKLPPDAPGTVTIDQDDNVQLDLPALTPVVDTNLIPGNGFGLTEAAGFEWADIDRDGDLDVAVHTSREQAGYFNSIQIYRNEIDQGNGLQYVTEIADSHSITGFAWGDANLDGTPDLAISRAGLTQVYTTDPSTGQLSLYAATVGGGGGVAWGDLNGDGTDDVIGIGATPAIIEFGPNGSVNSRILAGFGDARQVDLGDYDKDGDFDLLVGGGNSSRIYRNVDGDFIATDLVFPRVGNGTLEFGDDDGDGDLDILIDSEQSGVSIFHNTSGSFTQVYQNNGSIDGLLWYDHDGDSDRDLLIHDNFGDAANFSGSNTQLLIQTAAGQYIPKSAREITAPLNLSSWTVAQISQGGGLDVLAVENVAAGTATGELFRNVDPTFDDRGNPPAPSGLFANTFQDETRVVWNAPDFDGTLEYNLRVQSESDSLTGPKALDDGRQIFESQSRLSATTIDLVGLGLVPGQSYRVGVQAIDSVGRGSEWTWYNLRVSDSLVVNVFDGDPVFASDVNDGDPLNGRTTLREAVDLANTADPDEPFVITFAGLGTITANSPYAISQSVTIDGYEFGADRIVIEAGGANRLFILDDGDVANQIEVFMDDLVLNGGFADFGGSIFSNENLTLDDIAFFDSEATLDGGAIFATVPQTGRLQLSGVRAVGAEAGRNGGAFAIVNHGVVEFVASDIFAGSIDNSAGADGGTLYLNNQPTGRVFSTNPLGVNQPIIASGGTSQRGGGAAVFNLGGSVDLSAWGFNGNEATGHGGGLYLVNNDGDVRLGSRQAANQSTTGHGGGVYLESYGGTITTRDGFSPFTADGNQAIAGGALFASLNDDANLMVDLAQFENNTATGYGGGIAVENNGGTFELSQSTLSGNVASVGGGIHVESTGPVRFDANTIAGNRADIGGGISLQINDADATLVSNTISGNAVNASTSPASAIYATVDGTSNLDVVANTVAFNDATAGGTIGETVFVNNTGTGTTRLTNTVIADNAHVDGRTGFLYFGDPTKLALDSNFMGAGAGLKPLTYNGGSTATHELDDSSPLINQGASEFLLPAADQRGFTRAIGRPDIGSVERQEPRPESIIVSTLRDEADGDLSEGDVSLREAISLANAIPGPNTIEFAADLSGTIQQQLNTITFGRDLPITDDVNIVGPGADVLEIELFKFEIADSNPNQHLNVDISGLSFNTTELVSTENTTLSNVVLYRDLNAPLVTAAPELGARFQISESLIHYGSIVHNGPGETLIENTTILGQTIAGQNFASVVSNADSLTIRNSTILGTERQRDSNSGDVFVLDGGGIAGPATIDSSIVSFVDAGGQTIRNSLIINGDPGGLNEAPVGTPDANGNLIGSASGSGLIDPRFDELQPLGGQLSVATLRFDSPAIDAGSNPAGLTTDARGTGFDRVSGTATDIGAFESQPVTLIVTVGENIYNGDFSENDLSLVEAIDFSNQNPGVDTIRFDDELTAVDVRIADASFFSGANPIAAITESLNIEGRADRSLELAFGANGLPGFHFSDNDDQTDLKISISGITLTSESTSQLVGISATESLSFDNVTLATNLYLPDASQSGDEFGGDLTIRNSTFTLPFFDRQVVEVNGAGKEATSVTLENIAIASTTASLTGLDVNVRNAQLLLDSIDLQNEHFDATVYPQGINADLSRLTVNVEDTEVAFRDSDLRSAVGLSSDSLGGEVGLFPQFPDTNFHFVSGDPATRPNAPSSLFLDNAFVDGWGVPPIEATVQVSDEDDPVDIDLTTIAAFANSDPIVEVTRLFDALGGTVELLADGVTARFTPDPDFNGPASFRFSAVSEIIEVDTARGRDDVPVQNLERVTLPPITGGFSSGTISIDVVPVDDPYQLDVEQVTATEDEALEVDLLNFVSDIDSSISQLTFTLKSASAEIATAQLLQDGHTVRLMFLPDYFGPAGFVFDVTDGQTTYTDLTVPVAVASVNDAPTLNVPSTTVTILHDELYSLGSVSADDIDSTNVTVTLSVFNGQFRFNGNDASELTLTGTAGEVNTALSNTEFVPASEDGGTAVVNVAVTDGELEDAASFVISVIPLDRRPQLALPDSINTTENVPVAVPGIQFADEDSETLTVTVSTQEGTLNWDGESTASIVRSGTPTALNSLIASLQFNPAQEFFGLARVLVTVTDGTYTTTGEVPIGVSENPAPVLTVDASTVSIGEGQTATNAGNWSDSGGDDVTLDASLGTVTKNADGTWSWSFDTSDGPDQSQTVTITATDSDGAATTTTFDLTVNNVAPNIYNNGNVTLDEGQTASNSGNWSDPGADDVTLAASLGTVTKNADGTWSWSFDTSDGPDESQTVTITATDSDGAATATSFDLTVNNVAPNISNNGNVTLDEGQTATNSGNWSDPGVDDVTLAASLGTVTKNADGTWSWSFDTSDGPDESQTVTITATDSDGAATTTTFDLTVNNVAPNISNNGNVTLDEGQTATNTGNWSDPGGDDVTLAASLGTVTKNADGTWSWSFDTSDGPDESQTVTITATDSDGAATTTSFDLTVNNVAPNISNNGNVTLDEGQTATNTGNWSDLGGDDVTLAASLGTVTKNADGTWSWSFDTSDGPDESQTVTITATDSDGAATTTTFDLTVNNVAPELQLNPVAAINENGVATLRGTIIDPGKLDSFTIEVNWGDPRSPNNTETYTFDASETGSQPFTFTHQYLDDNPTATSSDAYTIRVHLLDDDGQSDIKTTPVTVTNVAPRIDAVFATALTDNLLDNGEFEQSPRLKWRGQNHQKYAWFKSDKIPGWTATGLVQTIEIQEGDHGTGVASNDQVAELDQGRELSQTFTIKQDGEIELSIDVAKRNSLASENGVAVYIDDHLLMTIHPQVNSPETFTESVNLGSGEHVVKLVGLSQSPHIGSVVDNVLIRQRIVLNQDSIEGIDRSFDPDDVFADDDFSGELVKRAVIGRSFRVETHGRFEFEFDAARTSHQSSKNGFKVLLDGEEFKRIDPDSADLQRYVFELDLFAGEHTLQFVSLSRSSDHGSLIENVSLQQTKSLDSMQVDLCVHSDGSVDLDGTFFDIGSIDTHKVTVDWGDGNSEVLYDFADLDRGFTGNHFYQNGGVYEIKLTLVDDDGGVDTSTQLVAIRGASLIDGTLYIIGADQRDEIEIHQYHDKIKVRDNLHGKNTGWLYFPKSEVRSILIGSCDGNDQISVQRPSFVPVKVQAGGGDNSIQLGDGHEIITSGSGDDNIHFGDGLFTIDAGDGRNHVHGDNGSGSIVTGDGNDSIRIDDGDVTIDAGEGNNQIDAGDGIHILTTGNGNDKIRVDDGVFEINAGGGHNDICVGDGDGTIVTGDGYDELHLHRGNHIINVGHGGSEIDIQGDGDNRISAGDGRDKIKTRDGRQIIITGAGNDDIRTGSGDDLINAGDDHDTIKSGSGNDIVLGGSGNDQLYGDRGRDLLIGGIGEDRIYGGRDDDLLIAGSSLYDDDQIALDTIMAEWTSDRAFRTRVSNLQSGVGTNADIVLIANQTVLSDDDRDRLYGDPGNDFLIADSTDDKRG
ncbi:choice-of-anchor Q domain-containing protein [Stieleria neptunia]|uniref:choice-of-anchor Q domain-containing protein n=1 Tax=Stieleria neptunia TaxID=2527979 RepID=UPI0018D1F95D|nr:choice-of-anchor Q domain-containing protein [Stieleria neptunia]